MVFSCRHKGGSCSYSELSDIDHRWSGSSRQSLDLVLFLADGHSDDNECQAVLLLLGCCDLEQTHVHQKEWLQTVRFVSLLDIGIRSNTRHPCPSKGRLVVDVSTVDECQLGVLLLLLVVPADSVKFNVLALLFHVVDIGLMKADGCLVAAVLDSVSSQLCDCWAK